jgi:hypothetical protein
MDMVIVVKARRLNWTGYTNRMDDDRNGRKIFNSHSEDVTTRGRQR